MSKPYIWKTADYVAAEVMNRLIGETGLTLNALQEKSGNTIGYNRFRDIQKGLKAPMRLSEFLTICDVCQVDAVETLRTIRDEAKLRDRTTTIHLPDEEKRNIGMPKIDDSDVVSAIAAHPGDYDIAANHDVNKMLEAETPRD